MTDLFDLADRLAVWADATEIKADKALLNEAADAILKLSNIRIEWGIAYSPEFAQENIDERDDERSARAEAASNPFGAYVVSRRVSPWMIDLGEVH